MYDWLLHDRVGEVYVALGILVAGAIVAYAFGRGVGAGYSRAMERSLTTFRRLRS
jgi:hypothetical protein